MKASINQQWLHLTSFDSAAPSGGATIVHRFERPGEYRVRFVRGEETVAETSLAVAHEEAGRTSASAHVMLDLTKLADLGKLTSSTGKREYFAVRHDGYVSFTDSGKTKPFAVIAESKQDEGVVFDSHRLRSGDIFALTLLRPGEYRVANELTCYEGRITVAYPVIGKVPYRPPEPFSVDCTEDGFQPKAIDLKPAQGLIFRIHTAARIRIDLIRPDDGPEEPSRPIASYSQEQLIAALERLRDARKKK